MEHHDTGLEHEAESVSVYIFFWFYFFKSQLSNIESFSVPTAFYYHSSNDINLDFTKAN